MENPKTVLEQKHRKTNTTIFLASLSVPHLQHLMNLARDPSLGERMGWSPYFEPDETELFIDAISCIALPYSIQANPAVFGIYPNLEQWPVGYAVLKGINHELGTAEAGIAVLDPDYNTRGFGRLALDRIVRYAFDELHLSAVGAAILATNNQSINMCRKTGFGMREVMPDSWTMPDGRVVDMLWMERRRS